MSTEEFEALNARVAAVVAGQARLEAQVTRVLLGFVGEDNHLYPGLLSRLATLEQRMDMATKALIRIGWWSVRALGVLVVLVAIQTVLGMHVNPLEAFKALMGGT